MLLAAILAIQTPQVQTCISEKVLTGLSDRLDGTVSFDKIHFKPFNALIIKNLTIKDKAPRIAGMDTLFHAEYIIARFSIRGLFNSDGLYVRRAYVSNAEMNLAIEPESVNLVRIFRIPPPEKKEDNGKHIFTIRRASIDNMTFRMKNIKDNAYRHTGSGINWSDMEITSIEAEARNIDMTGKVMSGNLDFLSFREKSGYVCNSLSGKTRVGNGTALIEEIRLSDPWSEIYVPEYSMSYSDVTDFEDYVNKVMMYGTVEGSNLDMRSISYFAPGLENVTMKAFVNGKVSGPVCDMIFSDMDIVTDEGLSMQFDGRLSGLPDINSTRLSLVLDNMDFTAGSLESAVASFSPDMKLNIGGLAKGVKFNMDGKVSGSFNDMNIRMTASADSGSVSTELRMRNLLSRRNSIVLEGNIRSRDMDIGSVIGSDLVRQCSLFSSFKANLGNRNGEPEMKLDSLIVHRLRINDYNYRGIAAAGTMKKDEFDGKIICNDPNLNFLFQGIFTLSSKTRNAVYRFYANLGYADLNALNFDKRGISKVRFQTMANFNRIGAGDILGNIELADIVLENGSGKHDIGNINVTSYSSEDLFRMNLNSSFADASFVGTNTLRSFIKDMTDVTLRRELPALFRDSVKVKTGNRYKISLRCHNSMDLLAYMMPGLYISDSTALDVSIDTSGLFKARMTSPRIAFNENFIKGVEFNFDNREGSLGGELTGSMLNVTTLSLEKNSFKFYAKDNFIGLGYSYENKGDLINQGEFVVTSNISRTDDNLLKYHIDLLPSRIFLNSRQWSINSSSIDITGKDIDVNNVEFTSGDQIVSVYGGLSDTDHDTLTVRLERFDISIANPVIGEKFGLSGAATGRAQVISPSSDRGLLFRFLCDSTSIAGTRMGTVLLSSEWNDNFRRFDINMNNSIDNARTFDISGNYSPSLKRLEVAANLDRFDIGYAKPFTEEIFSGMEGHISGELYAEGTLDNLKISSRNARIDDSMLRIAFTNVPYNASGGFHIDDDGLHFDSISISDRHGNKGSITGGIYFNDFSDMQFDTRINVNEMECLALEEKDNSTFYGSVFGSGNLELTGSPSSVVMNINARTTGTGQLHIPIPSSANAATSDLLTFKQEEKEIYIDPYEEMIKKITTEKKASGNFGVKARISATPGVEAFIEIDKATGNVLRGRGSGTIDLDLKNDNFNIYGDYTLTSGSYRFVAQGIAYRDFTIKDGSSVKFYGDIMESTLDINATYRTKTSLSSLIADTSSVATRRTVECGIQISDKIKNPRLAFSIDIPDIDPTVKSRVESALSTEDKVQKQFLSLIVFNSFLPDEQSGVVNNAMLYSTVTEIMYNQLNNIFQKLDIPLDLGLSYQPNEKGNDIFDVAVSTQLFNNRVVVNGNIGNRQYNTSGNSNSDVVGDLDIEIKLDRPGLFRLNIFSHSADQYTNYLDNSQRNGIGIAYQQEFNTFKEFFTNLFTGKKKKEARAVQEAEKAMRQERKTIIIQPDNNGRRKRKTIPDTVASRRK